LGDLLSYKEMGEWGEGEERDSPINQWGLLEESLISSPVKG
jgi:hypothetical protein